MINYTTLEGKNAEIYIERLRASLNLESSSLSLNEQTKNLLRERREEEIRGLEEKYLLSGSIKVPIDIRREVIGKALRLIARIDQLDAETRDREF